MLELTLNPGLTLTGFRTTRPRSASLQVYKSASLQVCKSASLQVCKSASLQVCKSASLQVCSLQVSHTEANLRGIWGYVSPENLEFVHCKRCDFMHFWGKVLQKMNCL